MKIQTEIKHKLATNKWCESTLIKEIQEETQTWHMTCPLCYFDKTIDKDTYDKWTYYKKVIGRD